MRRHGILQILLSSSVITSVVLLGELASADPSSDEPSPSWTHQLLNEALVRRNLEARRRLETEIPVGVRKMSDDPSEMFFPHYWQFDLEEEPSEMEQPLGQSHQVERRSISFSPSFDNSTAATNLLPPFRLHTEEEQTIDFGLRHFPRNVFDKRDFQCPSGTNACTNINQTNSCCGTKETCVLINGQAGCCPNGMTCTGSIGPCDTAAGYTACPNSPNGGCCIPNYQCNGVGCAAARSSTTTLVSVVTVTITPGQTTTTSTSSRDSPPTTTTETVMNTSTPDSTDSNSFVSTVTVFTTLPENTTTATVTASNANLTTVTESTTVASAAPPVRPTSEVSITSSASDIGFCPVGYYVCSAYYPGGCCRVGRNCDTSNCPASATQTVVSSGVTVIVPGIGPATTLQSGGVTDPATITTETGSSCPTGWSTCGTIAGGGCCPSGYSCGQSCRNTATAGPATVARVAPQSNGSPVVNRSTGKSWAIPIVAVAFSALNMW